MGRDADQLAPPNLPGSLEPEAGVRADNAAASEEPADLRALDPESPSTGDRTEPETPVGTPVVPLHADRGHASRPLVTSAAAADALPAMDVTLDRRSTPGTLHATATRAERAAGDAVERPPKPDLDARSLVATATPTGGDAAESAAGTTPPTARSLGAESLVSAPSPATPATATAPAAAADAVLTTTGIAPSDASSVSTPAPPAEARLPHPPQSPAFAAALGQQVSLWIRRGVQQAVLQLNPAELGPVAIHIALDGARAHVDFTAPHAATRAALEGSLPVLASALRDSGLTLAGGGVFDRPREQADGNGQGQTPAWAGNARTQDPGRPDALPTPAVLHRRGVVDLVA